MQVASTQNFTKAAQILGYSQSNVSTQIQQLEEEVGQKLFDRVGRGVILTQYGQQIVPYAQQIIQLATQMNSSLWKEDELSGTLRVGMVESLFDLCFAEMILDYAARFPKVKVDLTLEATPRLLEMLKNGQLDIACLIGNALSAKEENCFYSKEVEIVVVASQQNKLASEKCICLENLRNERFILMEDIAPYTVHFIHALTLHSVDIQIFLSLQNARMARVLVEGSQCLSFLPYYAVKKSVQNGKITCLNIQNYTQMQLAQLVLHQERIITPQIHGFLEVARSILEKCL